jgi:hypothetical protein
MPEDHGAPGEDIIDVLVTIHIPHLASLGLGYKDRLSFHGFEGPHRTVDPTGQIFLGLGKESLGPLPLNHVKSPAIIMGLKSGMLADDIVSY